jgi:transcriptional regulator with XRE-family HTH domain
MGTMTSKYEVKPMTNINGSAIRQCRERKDWSQEDLAARSKVDKGTISRLERGAHSSVRGNTLRQLAEALSVSVKVLTGETPLPAVATESLDSGFNQSQMNIRIGNDARNALALVARRYGLSQSNIVALAPFLFACAAESCLKKRADRLKEIESKATELSRLGDQFPHAAKSVFNSWEMDEVLNEERSSIQKKQLFLNNLKELDENYLSDPDYDDEQDGPFVRHLKEMAAELGEGAEFKNWYSGPDYRVCESEAHMLAGDDSDAAEQILDGFAPLHEMPRELARSGSTSERVDWILQRAQKTKDLSAKLLESFTLDDFKFDAVQTDGDEK